MGCATQTWGRKTKELIYRYECDAEYQRRGSDEKKEVNMRVEK